MTRGPKEETTLQSWRCGGRWLEIKTRAEKKRKTKHEYKGNEQQQQTCLTLLILNYKGNPYKPHFKISCLHFCHWITASVATGIFA